MLTTMKCAEKSFEIWPGLLHVVASGPDALDAVDAGYDVARALSASLMADASAIASCEASTESGAAARAVLVAVEAFASMLRSDDLPPDLVALPGAVCDVVLATMRAAGKCDFVAVSLGDVMTFEGRIAEAADVVNVLPLLLTEFLRASPLIDTGAVALAGVRCGAPSDGIADRAAVLAPTGAQAAFAVTALAMSCGVQPGMALSEARPRDRLYDIAWLGRRVIDDTGHMEPEAVWDGLSGAARLGRTLLDRGAIKAAAITLKGRGRVLGRLKGDALLRFGVSEWR